MEQSPEPDGSVTSLVALAAYFTAYIGEKAENPADDLTSELATSIYPDGSEPPIGERIRLATMLFAAGQDTTAKLLGNAMRYIIENPALQDRSAAIFRWCRHSSRKCCASKDRPR
jgi:cytochrome P450